MFYKDENFSQESPKKEFFLLNNFLDKIPLVVDEIAIQLEGMSIEEIDKMKTHFSLSKIMNDTFQLIAQGKRDFKIEQITNPKEIYIKLTINGLTGDTLSAKLSLLDWLWEKAENLFTFLRDGKHITLFYQLINQLKSILSSLLNCLGINTDIYNEAFDLLMSFLEMCNQDYQS